MCFQGVTLCKHIKAHASHSLGDHWVSFHESIEKHTEVPPSQGWTTFIIWVYKQVNANQSDGLHYER